MNFWKIFGGGRESVDDYRDFVNRYEQGSPHEGYWMKKFPAATSKYPGRCPPIFIKSLHKKPLAACPTGAHAVWSTSAANASKHNSDPDQDGQDDRFQDPNYLAQVTGRIHQQQPDMLGQLMGSRRLMGGQGGGNVLGNPHEGSDGWYSSHGSQKMMGGGTNSQGQYPPSQRGPGDPADAGQYGNIRPASEGPYGDPADDRRNTW